MVIFDEINKSAFLKPYKPNKNSKTLVITVAKYFADKLNITPTSRLMMSLEDDGKTLKIQKLGDMNNDNSV
jgi:hypothetical protein